MDDKRIQYTEYMVGAGHSTKPDTLNRLTLVEHHVDGTHDFTKVAPIEMGVNGGNAHDHSGGGGAPIDHTNLLNAGATTHSQIDTALNRLANTSGTNTGDQSLDHLATKTEVTSGLSGKQVTLVSGTNIKKILDKDLLGAGNIDIGHEELNNIGTNSHLDIDVALGRLENTSGTNTGDQSLDHLATTEDLTTAIGEYGVTGGDGHTHTDGDGAPLSHGQLANIGTNSHSSIDNHIASTSNPHGVTAHQVGFGNKSTLDKISEALGKPLWDGGVWPGGGGGGGGENEITYSDAGVIAPPVLTDNGDGSVTLGVGEYVLYNTVNSFPAMRYEISGNTFTLTDNSLNYIKAKHTGVTQQLICDTNETDINHLTVVPIVTIYRKGTTLVRMEWNRFGIGLADKLVNRLIRTQRYNIEPGGFVLGEAATRYVTVTAGTVWTGGKSVMVGAHNSSTDNTNLVVSNGMGGWTYSAITQYNNTQYDNGSGAKTLTDGHYAVNWVIKRFATPTNTVCIMLGQGDYSLIEATQATPPELPAELYAMGMIVGRIIVKKGDSTATQIDSAFVRHFGKLAIGSWVPSWDDVTGKPANYPTSWATVSDKPVVQTTGLSTTNLMSQKAVTDAIAATAPVVVAANATVTLTNGRAVYAVNTTSAARTLTLPANPPAGATVTIIDYANTCGINALTIARNGRNIEGAAANAAFTQNGQRVEMVYIDADQGWKIISSYRHGSFI